MPPCGRWPGGRSADLERAVFPGFDFPVTARAALLVIDMQPWGVGAEGGLVQAIERTAPGYPRHLTARVRETVIPNTLRLLDAFHRLRRPVYFTAFASATGDGRDVTTATIRYRRWTCLPRPGWPRSYGWAGSRPCTGT